MFHLSASQSSRLLQLNGFNQVDDFEYRNTRFLVSISADNTLDQKSPALWNELFFLSSRPLPRRRLVNTFTGRLKETKKKRDISEWVAQERNIVSSSSRGSELQISNTRLVVNIISVPIAFKLHYLWGLREKYIYISVFQRHGIQYCYDKIYQGMSRLFPQTERCKYIASLRSLYMPTAALYLIFTNFVSHFIWFYRFRK
jgi:hypothetical protein